MIEIAERAGRPQPLTELVAGDKVARTLQEGGQDLEGLLLQTDTNAGLAQLA